MEKKRNITTFIVIFIIMATVAMVDNTKGVFVPAFKQTFNTNNTSIGYIMTASSLGYIIFTYFGGILCEKFGQKKIIHIGIISIIASLCLGAMAKNFLILLGVMFMINMGIAFIMIGLNTLIPVLFVACQGIMMNMAHSCYGFGSTIGQFAIGKMFDMGIGWRTVFLGIAIIFVIILILVLRVDLPKVSNNGKSEKLSIVSVFKEKYMYVYVIALGTYIFAEMGMSNWVVNFLIDRYQFTNGKATTILSAFFLLLTIGRLIGGFIVEKIGYLQSVIISLTIALILLIVSLIGGSSMIILICVAGFFFAIAYPTTVATISKVFSKGSAYITGVILTLASTINMILNLVIGRLSDVIGTERAFYLIPASLTISIIFVVIIYIGKRDIFKRGGTQIE